jgi:hypothetical protein
MVSILILIVLTLLLSGVIWCLLLLRRFLREFGKFKEATDMVLSAEGVDGSLAIDLDADPNREMKDIAQKFAFKDQPKYTMPMFGIPPEEAAGARELDPELITPGLRRRHSDIVFLTDEGKDLAIRVIEFQSTANAFDTLRFLGYALLLSLKYSFRMRRFVPPMVTVIYSAGAGGKKPLALQDRDGRLFFVPDSHNLPDRIGLEELIEKWALPIEEWTPPAGVGPVSMDQLPMTGIEFGDFYFSFLGRAKDAPRGPVLALLDLGAVLADKARDPKKLALMATFASAAGLIDDKTFKHRMEVAKTMGLNYTDFLDSMTGGDYSKTKDQCETLSQRVKEAAKRAEVEAKRAEVEAEARLVITRKAVRSLSASGKTREEIGLMLELNLFEVDRFLES